MSDDRKFKTSAAKLLSSRLWKLRNREAVLIKNKERNIQVRSTAEGREKKREADSKSRKKYSEKWINYDKQRDKQKVSARNIVRDRIYRGTMVRGNCEVCGAFSAQAHHEDYSKPMEIRWLCPQHHKDIHNGKIK
jgi:phosphotransacetylase